MVCCNRNPFLGGHFGRSGIVVCFHRQIASNGSIVYCGSIVIIGYIAFSMDRDFLVPQCTDIMDRGGVEADTPPAP
jgi:hypothetical protein